MQFVVSRMAPVHVNVYLNIMAIHTKAVAQNVRSIAIARRIGLAFGTNVLTHVLVYVLKMQNVKW